MSKLPIVPMAELRPMNRKLRKSVPQVEPSLFKRELYTCPELGRTCNRPNAYDAYDLPSLYGNDRRPYRFSRE